MVSHIALRVVVLMAVSTVVAAEPTRTEDRAPCADFHPLRHPYFGDLHVHTALSLDASTQGTRAMPEDAYRFGRGAALGIQPFDDAGRALRHLQLDRPLDFMAVTDHSELFGELEICNDPTLAGHSSLVCRLYRWWPRLAFFVMNSRSTRSTSPTRFAYCGDGGAGCIDAAHTPWRRIRDAAEAAYDRSAACRFTTFIGYEWTGGPGTNNIHRNVLFRNAVVPDLPISYLDEPSPERLRQRLREVCRERLPGCDVLSIPHNSNISGGRMFAGADAAGVWSDAAAARAQAEAEPLVEIMQHKGESECRIGPENEDELCGFEKLPYANFQQKYVPFLASPPGRMNFVRNVLRDGLLLDRRIGANPYKLGIVASTDTHLGAGGYVREDDHPGHGGAGIAAPGELPPGLLDDIEFNPGGIAAIWAEENSRDALFEAMRRREVYGTSGPRIVARFFAGWHFPADLCEREDLVEIGYRDGVPMGGDLASPPPGEAAPWFVVTASQDPGTADRPGTPLQRVQIVKAWTQGGETREKVYDIAGSEDVGKVDERTCERDGAGSSRLCAVWHDPEFDPNEHAFYYARVLEVPVCRWSTRACNAAGVRCEDARTITSGFESCCDARYAATIQERAWTSPIWYAGAGQ